MMLAGLPRIVKTDGFIVSLLRRLRKLEIETGKDLTRLGFICQDGSNANQEKVLIYMYSIYSKFPIPYILAIMS